ncbi:hypothetical protein V3C99_010905, partial [Haemonchus contortus]
DQFVMSTGRFRNVRRNCCVWCAVKSQTLET